MQHVDPSVLYGGAGRRGGSVQVRLRAPNGLRAACGGVDVATLAPGQVTDKD